MDEGRRRRLAILTTSPRLSNGREQTSTDAAPESASAAAAPSSPRLRATRGGSRPTAAAARAEETGWGAVGALKRASVNDLRRLRGSHAPPRRGEIVRRSCRVNASGSPTCRLRRVIALLIRTRCRSSAFNDARFRLIANGVDCRNSSILAQASPHRRK